MRKLACLVLVLFAAAALAQPQTPAGASVLKIPSKVLGEERTILVRTPPGYDNGAARYPVLYLTDGDAHLAHTAATVDFLARNGRMSQLIMIGITNTDRTRDLTPTRATMTRPDGSPIEFPTAGGADRFLQFIENELVPHIEANYRTQPYRLFSGHSFGGLFAMHTLFSRPQLFQGIIAVSPTLRWDNDLVVRRATEFFKDRKDQKTTLYVTIGNEGEDLDAAFLRLKKVLGSVKARGFAWGADRLGDEDHGSLVLPSHYDGLRKIYAGWQVARDPKTNAIVGGWAGAQAHYKNLSERFGYDIPVPETVANQIGYEFLFADKPKEAIEIFEWNVSTYPQSANVYDSLAEAQEKIGALEQARQNYEKAAELGKKSNDPNQQIYETNARRVTERLAAR